MKYGAGKTEIVRSCKSSFCKILIGLLQDLKQSKNYEPSVISINIGAR